MNIFNFGNHFVLTFFYKGNAKGIADYCDLQVQVIKEQVRS